MSKNDKVTVVILDRSKDVRDALSLALIKEADLLVIGTMSNTTQLMDTLNKQAVDVVVLDIEATGAVQAVRDIRELCRSRPADEDCGVLLVARRTDDDAEMTIQGLEAGAFDVMLRPLAQDTTRVVDSLSRQLLVKLRYFSSKRIFACMPGEPRQRKTTPAVASAHSGRFKALLAGSSTGGPRALADILPAICAATDLPVLVTQHMPAKFTASLAQSLDAKCKHHAAEAQDGEPLEPGRIYVAPGGCHMFLRNSGTGTVLAVNEEPPIKGCRPSVDLLFSSAAKTLGSDVLAMILTGMGNDGLDGARDLRQAGAVVLAQDEPSSVVWGMPGAVATADLADQVVDIKHMAATVNTILRGDGDGTR